MNEMRVKKILVLVFAAVIVSGGYACGGGGDGGGGGDRTAPTAPSNLTATAVSSTQINLAWTASSDYLGVVGYRIFRGGTQIGTSPGTAYNDTGLIAGDNYCYTVKAADAAGNVSAESNQACATPPGMALVPAGCFNMGDAFGEGFAQELPVHNVCFTSSFFMDVHEVTNAEYQACVDAGACVTVFNAGSYSRAIYFGDPAYDNFPVIFVSWGQATAYCTWAGKRLPTEAEWEYAARGGLAGKRYPWGDSIGGADANYLNSGDPWDNDTSPVEYYAANGYGLYDMGGNVWEWVNDWYSSTYYSVSPPSDPPGPATGASHVVRGGGWYQDPSFMRVSFRGYYFPTDKDTIIGFRCAAD